MPKREMLARHGAGGKPRHACLLYAQGLNVNRGQVIKLRLRRAGSGNFLHYESVGHFLW